MESFEAEVTRLDHAYQLGARSCAEAVDRCLQGSLHPDYAMDRVIRAALEIVARNLFELAQTTPYKDALACPLSANTNQTTSPSS